MAEPHVERSNGGYLVREPLVPEPTAHYCEVVQARRPAAPLPRPSPIPIPIPIPLQIGSRFLIWKQDPSVTALGLRTVFVPSLVLNGPRDARLTIELPGTTPVNRNVNGDFIFASGTPELDCAHTFAVVRETLTMYERVNGGTAIPFAWNTGGNTDPITAFPHAGVTPNAFYSRGDKALKFFFFTPSGAPVPVFTCRSLDIVAHETGHAVLDGLKPGWLGVGNPPQTGGLHEAFGDLTAIFLALSQLDQVEAFIAMSKANLHAKNFLAAMAEEFGSALGMSMGLRNADNDLKLSQVSNEVHAISQVFTGGIYDVLADIFAFEKNQQARTKDPAQVLLEVGQHLCGLLLNGIKQAPATGAAYADVVNKMLVVSQAQGDPPIYRTFIRNRFTLREVVVSPTPVTAMARGTVDFANPNFTDGEDVLELKRVDHASLHAAQDRSGCCGTMQLPEYILGDQKKLQAGKPIGDEDLLAEHVKELGKAFH